MFSTKLCQYAKILLSITSIHKYTLDNNIEMLCIQEQQPKRKLVTDLPTTHNHTLITSLVARLQ